MLFILLCDFFLMLGLIVSGVWLLIFGKGHKKPTTRNAAIGFRLVGLGLLGCGLWLGWAVFHL